MTDRDRQRERLADLMRQAAPPYTGLPNIDYLLDNGITVELPPPEPEVKPGTTGTATVGTDETVRWLKDWDGYQYVSERTQGFSREGSPMLRDIVSDPEPLTAEILNAAVDTVWGKPGFNQLSAGDIRIRLWRALEPYVAKGGGHD